MLDITRETFSVFGSYLALSYYTAARWGNLGNTDGDCLCLRNVGDTSRYAAAVFAFDGEKEIVLTPGKPEVKTNTGAVGFAFADEKTLLIRGRNAAMTMRFTLGGGENAQAHPGGAWYINAFCQHAQLMLVPVRGELIFENTQLPNGSVSASLKLPEGDWEFAAEIFEGGWEERFEFPDFDLSSERYRGEFERFYAAFPPVSPEYAEADRRAAYVGWSSTVSARGELECPAMLMSKNWMNSLWSWDNCFNAMALALGNAHPKFAFDQLTLPFYRQLSCGILPDTRTHTGHIYGFTKPPVHGWALTNMMKNCSISDSDLEWFYPKLAAWTDYWFRYADWDGDGLCQYSHGNDSGWDNCTGYLAGLPIEGPDLAAYLSLQLETLSVLARRFGKNEDAEKYAAASERQIKLMIPHFWNGKKFLIMQSGTHKVCGDSDSLYSYLPLILGHRLPREIFNTMAAWIRHFCLV